MKISVSKLKEFKASTSFIRHNDIIPALSYLRFKDGTVTKNNLTVFAIKDVGGNESLLIEEHILMSLVDRTAADFIEITKHGSRIKITDGEGVFFSATEDMNVYPINDLPTQEYQHLSTEAVDAIATASRYVLANEPYPTAKSFVFVGKEYVCGSNAYIAFIEKVGKIPEMVLTQDMAKGLLKCSDLQFSQNDSYYFFKSGDMLFGMCKPEYKFFDMTPFSKFQKDQKTTTKKDDLISFNDRSLSVMRTKIKKMSMEMNGTLKLRFIDDEYESEGAHELKATGEMPEKFVYDPALMNTVLRSIDDESIDMYVRDKKMFISNDPARVSVLMGMAE